MLAAIKTAKDVIDEFDENLFLTLMDAVTVKVDGSLVYTFKNGMEVEV